MKDNDDPTAYAWYFELFRVVAFLLVAFFDWKLIITPYSFVLFIFLGLTEFLATYWFMKMHSYSHLSVSTILSRTRMIWIPILSFFLIHEALTNLDYIGIAIIFLGVSLTSAPTKLFIDKGAMYANASAFFVALNIILIVMLLPYGSNATILAIGSIPSVFLFPLFMKNRKNRLKEFFKKRIFLKTITLVIHIVASLLFMIALRLGEASKVNAVYQGMMILSVLAGIIFLKERTDIVKKLLGATITIVGVVLLSFS